MKDSAIGYIRVSTADQPNSLEVQEKSIRQYCLFKNLDLFKIIIDEDVSGFKEIYKRKGGAELQELLIKHPNIIATKPDRLFRNVENALITVRKWNSKNIALHITDVAGATIDTRTAIGRLMFTTIISFSEFERNITGERTKSVLNNKKATGKVYCRSILGFDNVNGELIPNPSEQFTIQRIKTLAENNMPTSIARILNHEGYKTKSGKEFKQSTIDYILKNPIYA